MEGHLLCHELFFNRIKTMENQRECTRCKEIKLFTEFYKSKNKKFGIECMCKACSSSNKKKNYNKAKKSEQHKKYYDKNKERISLRDKEKVGEIRNVKRLYRKNNKEKVNKYKREYRKNKASTNYKIAELIRNRIRSLLSGKMKNPKRRTFELLGCNYTELKIHLESQFTNGMTWENRGKDGWHIEHIIPCASFDLTDETQQNICFNYKNLRPLWGTTSIAIRYGENESYIGNLEKGNKII